jgi:hypothetical protein
VDNIVRFWRVYQTSGPVGDPKQTSAWDTTKLRALPNTARAVFGAAGAIVRTLAGAIV